MKRILVLLLSLAATPLLATENFSTNPHAVYPPGCATLKEYDPENGKIHGETEELSSGTINLVDLSDAIGPKSTVFIRTYRKGCSEEGRSILMMDFEVIKGGSAIVPTVALVVGEEIYVVRLASDPNSFQDFQSSLVLFSGQVYSYFVEGPLYTDVPILEEAGLPIITPEVYNGSFTVQFTDIVDFSTWNTPEMPAYEDQLQMDNIPFNGRLSGNWVVADAADQGFVIAFEELADGTPFIFLSWYTYDAEGKLLWLTAASPYTIGDSSIQLPIELVTNGEFMSNKTADREVVGSGTLVSVHCNNMQWTFDLSQLGLGSATVTLKRIFSLETGGYACRDQAEREATQND